MSVKGARHLVVFVSMTLNLDLNLLRFKPTQVAAEEEKKRGAEIVMNLDQALGAAANAVSSRPARHLASWTARPPKKPAFSRHSDFESFRIHPFGMHEQRDLAELSLARSTAWTFFVDTAENGP